MSWAEVLGLSRTEIPLDGRQVRVLGQQLVALELPHAYLQGRVRESGAQVMVEPRRAIWATNDEVARAIENPAIASSPRTTAGAEPPVELWSSGPATYRSVMRALRDSGVRALESASYSRTGTFVIRSVLGDGAEYFFSGNEPADEEMVVAIARRIGA